MLYEMEEVSKMVARAIVSIVASKMQIRRSTYSIRDIESNDTGALSFPVCCTDDKRTCDSLGFASKLYVRIDLGF